MLNGRLGEPRYFYRDSTTSPRDGAGSVKSSVSIGIELTSSRPGYEELSLLILGVLEDHNVVPQVLVRPRDDVDAFSEEKVSVPR